MSNQNDVYSMIPIDRSLPYLLLLFLLSTCLIGCRPHSDRPTEDEELVMESNEIEQAVEVQETVFRNNAISVVDSSDYSIEFLESAARQLRSHITLDSHLMIIDKTDTAAFPELPPFGRPYTLTRRSGDMAIALTVERINQSSIDYRIEMIEFGGPHIMETGQAHLRPTFWLASEVDVFDQTNTGYFSDEYADHKDSCYTYIRIGTLDVWEHGLLGKVNKNCNGELPDVDLNTFRTLIEK